MLPAGFWHFADRKLVYLKEIYMQEVSQENHSLPAFAKRFVLCFYAGFKRTRN